MIFLLSGGSAFSIASSIYQYKSSQRDSIVSVCPSEHIRDKVRDKGFDTKLLFRRSFIVLDPKPLHPGSIKMIENSLRGGGQKGISQGTSKASQSDSSGAGQSAASSATGSTPKHLEAKRVPVSHQSLPVQKTPPISVESQSASLPREEKQSPMRAASPVPSNTSDGSTDTFLDEIEPSDLPLPESMPLHVKEENLCLGCLKLFKQPKKSRPYCPSLPDPNQVPPSQIMEPRVPSATQKYYPQTPAESFSDQEEFNGYVQTCIETKGTFGMRFAPETQKAYNIKNKLPADTVHFIPVFAPGADILQARTELETECTRLNQAGNSNYQIYKFPGFIGNLIVPLDEPKPGYPPFVYATVWRYNPPTNSNPASSLRYIKSGNIPYEYSNSFRKKFKEKVQKQLLASDPTLCLQLVDSLILQPGMDSDHPVPCNQAVDSNGTYEEAYIFPSPKRTNQRRGNQSEIAETYSTTMAEDLINTGVRNVDSVNNPDNYDYKTHDEDVLADNRHGFRPELSPILKIECEYAHLEASRLLEARARSSRIIVSDFSDFLTITPAEKNKYGIAPLLDKSHQPVVNAQGKSYEYAELQKEHKYGRTWRRVIDERLKKTAENYFSSNAQDGEKTY